MSACPCGSNTAYAECCEPIITGTAKAATAEACMRARYTAYTKTEMPFIHDSLHPDKRSDYDENTSREWAESSTWQGLEILRTEQGGPDDDIGAVEFIATFTDKDGEERNHHELAIFKKEKDTWYFEDGGAPPAGTFVREGPKVGRNDPCPCGSGKKHKKCCMRKSA